MMGKRLFWVGLVYLMIIALSGCGKGSTAPSDPPVIISFAAIPDAVEPGESTTLMWTTMNADSCNIDCGVGAVPTSGSVEFWPGSSITITLTARKGQDTTRASVVVTMKQVAHMILDGTPSKKKKSYGSIYFDGYVKNDGNATGYNVMIQFKAYSDTGRTNIIDTASGFPADLGNIAPGQRARFEAIFFSINSWDRVKAWDYEISWLNVNFGPGAIRVKEEGTGFE